MSDWPVSPFVWHLISSAPKEPREHIGLGPPIILGFAPDKLGETMPSREGHWRPKLGPGPNGRTYSAGWVSTLDPHREPLGPQPTHWMPLPPEPTKSGCPALSSFEPMDCDWPVCGCDPAATKVIESLLESGWISSWVPQGLEERLAREMREAVRPYQRQTPGEGGAVSNLDWDEMPEVHQRPFRMMARTAVKTMRDSFVA